ncbi:MAG TPA: phosphoglycerate kinase [Gemmatimonadetes bacterium]|nr:phosphoglycerate kinase [Gemmatimonadota bacterium]
MKDGRITDDTRVRETLPTLRLLKDGGARTVVISHMGRPEGPDPGLSLQRVAGLLGDSIGGTVRFHPDLVGPGARAAVLALDNSEVLVLENTRFDAGETRNTPELARALADLVDHPPDGVFVNDAFGAAHRAHASTTGVADEMRRRGGSAVAGLLLDKELKVLESLLCKPKQPFVGILGGAKVSGKVETIRALLPRVDRLLVGGAMANTFLRALGLELGQSLLEEDKVELCHGILRDAGDRIVLPVDCLVAKSIEDGAAVRVVPRDSVQPDDCIGDIGPASRELFGGLLSDGRTVFWNGPMGVFEVPAFREGTIAMARSVATATDLGALTVVGGGDSAAALNMAHVADKVAHVSTGGGASLEFLGGEQLPGVAALSDR